MTLVGLEPDIDNLKGCHPDPLEDKAVGVPTRIRTGIYRSRICPPEPLADGDIIGETRIELEVFN